MSSDDKVFTKVTDWIRRQITVLLLQPNNATKRPWQQLSFDILKEQESHIFRSLGQYNVTILALLMNQTGSTIIYLTLLNYLKLVNMNQTPTERFPLMSFASGAFAFVEILQRRILRMKAQSKTSSLCEAFRKLKLRPGDGDSFSKRSSRLHQKKATNKQAQLDEYNEARYQRRLERRKTRQKKEQNKCQSLPNSEQFADTLNDEQR
ncbi:hypothetical protein O181_006766 [Austropuccinia psidii MF-1]|uniref:Uncharacterized protein n=1 Tax=Austropuccinia psidii MF-1 TaxID=1389203 RepID=A0A9Q3GH16_9BASI|nr:hypothetical protein [Austropuccinia psidii MF-1]